MISVIVPIFNVKPYLEEAIESIIYQTYNDLEIILVDDGSTDGSGEICDAYEKKDSRIKVIHQNNKGLSAARNVGLDVCSGEYITFLDSDDAFCKDYLRIMLESLQMYNADIAECNYAIIYNEHRMDESRINLEQERFSSRIKRAGTYDTKRTLNMLCSGEIAVNVWNKVYSQSIWGNLRFREGQNFEDTDIILSVLERAEKVYLLDESLVLHRKRSGSITQVYSYANISDHVLARQHFLEYIIEHTPMYFNQEVQYRHFEEMVNFLFSEYYRYAWLKIPDKKQCMEFLQKRIDEIGSEEDMNYCSTKVRIAVFLYAHMPRWTFMFVFCFFRFIMKSFMIMIR